MLTPQVRRWQQRRRVRRAVVVGESDYQPGHNLQVLPGAANDAERVAKTLEGLGFTDRITHLRDASKDQVLSALRNGVGDMRDDDVFLFYFSGHGYEEGHENRLVTVEGESISVQSDLLAAIERKARKAIVLVFLDCCRENDKNTTFLGRAPGQDDATEDDDIKYIKSVINTTIRTRAVATKNQFLIGYGCDPGRKSYEVNTGGLFTSALLKHIEEPILLSDLCTKVNASLAFDRTQRSWFNNAMYEDFSLSWDNVEGAGVPPPPPLAAGKLSFTKAPGDNPYAICKREFGDGKLYLELEYYGPLTNGKGEHVGRLTEESVKYLPDGAMLEYVP